MKKLNKRIVSALLAFVLLIGNLPVHTFAEDSYRSNISGTAIFNPACEAVYISDDPSAGWNSSEEYVLKAEELAAYSSLQMVIVDCYEGNGGYWYQVVAAEGQTLPEKMADKDWVYQNDIPNWGYADALIVTPPVIEPTEPSEPEETEPSESTEPSEPEETEPSESTEPSEPEETEPTEPGEVTTLPGTFVDGNGVTQTVTVTGALPEGAQVQVSVPEVPDVGEDSGVLDIKVLKPDGTEWQPIDEGKTVTISIPVSTDAKYVDVYHFIDHAADINGDEEILSMEGAPTVYLELLQPAIDAYGDGIHVAMEITERILVTDGVAAVETDSFSAYKWSGTDFIPIEGNDKETTETFPNNGWGKGDGQIVNEYYATPDHLFKLTTESRVSGATSCAFSIIFDEVDITSGTITGKFKTTVQNAKFASYSGSLGSYHSATIDIPDSALPGEVILVCFKTWFNTFYLLIHIVKKVDVSFESPSVVATNMPTTVTGVVTDGDSDKKVFTIPATVPKPNDEHYVFKGWNTSAAGDGDGYTYDPNTGKFTPEGFTPMRDMTLYAMWEAENYVVKFDTDGGTGNYEDVPVKNGASITLPEGPTKPDYTFLGWSASKDGYTKIYKAGDEFTVTQDVTLYALWTVFLTIEVTGGESITLQMEDEFEAVGLKDRKYAGSGKEMFPWTEAGGTTTYVSDPTVGYFKNARFTFTYDTSKKVTASTSNESLVSFIYQTGRIVAVIGPDGMDKSTTITFAAANKVYYVVSYDTDNGTEVPSDLLAEDNNTLSKLPETTRTGYEFAGWFLDGQRVNAPLTITRNTTLHARWTPKSYKVTWNVDGVKTEETCEFGSEISAPADPSREGYDFAGWDGYTNGMTMPAEDVEFIATWTPKNYNITYNLNDGSAIVTDTYTIESGEITLPIPTRTDYTFDGWYTTTDFSDSEVKVIPARSTGDKVFYAKWKLNSYTITFNTDGGTEVEEIEAEYEENVTLHDAPSKSGYIFMGWTYDADGSGTIEDGEIYQAGGSFTMPAEDITMTAKWLDSRFDPNINVYMGLNMSYHMEDEQYHCKVPQEPLPYKEDTKCARLYFDSGEQKWKVSANYWELPMPLDPTDYISEDFFNPDAAVYGGKYYTDYYKETGEKDTICISDTTGVVTKALLSFTQTDYDNMIYAWKEADRNTLNDTYPGLNIVWDKINADTYEVIPYVIKQKKMDNGELRWFIDVVIKPKQTYQVTYKMNLEAESGYAATAPVDDKQYGAEYPVKLEVQEDLSKEGTDAYRAKFLGWCYDANGNGAVDEGEQLYPSGGTFLMPNKNVTLIAEWDYVMDLTITTESTSDYGQYVFAVSGEGLAGDLKVVLGANDVRKIVDLPEGTYTVTCETAWSWRYEAPDCTEKTETSWKFEFKNPIAYWLSGEGFKKNRFSTN